MTFSNDKIITWHQMTNDDHMTLLLGLPIFFGNLLCLLKQPSAIMKLPSCLV